VSDLRNPTKVSDFMQDGDFADLLNAASRVTLDERDMQFLSVLSEKFRTHRGRAFVTKKQVDWLTSLANRGGSSRGRPVTWEQGAGKAERPMYAPPPPRQSELEEAGEKFIQATAQFVYALMRAVL
jgi:hypothetical protein